MIPTEQQMRDAYKNAPEYVQDFLGSHELDEIFENVRTAHKLHLDTAETVSRIISASALGLIPLEKVGEALKEALLNTDSATREALLKDINEKVFTELRLWAEADKEVEDEEEKTLSDSAPVHTETPQVAQKEPASPINKLETSIRERATDVEISDGAPTQGTVQKNDPAYSGTDPYREPIE